MEGGKLRRRREENAALLTVQPMKLTGWWGGRQPAVGGVPGRVWCERVPEPGSMCLIKDALRREGQERGGADGKKRKSRMETGSGLPMRDNTSACARTCWGEREGRKREEGGGGGLIDGSFGGKVG